MRSRSLLVALAIAVPFGAAACSSDDSTVATPQEGEAADSPNNDADVAFVQGMIPHHEQAVEMAGLAADRAEDPRVLDLASRIEAAQGPEIEQMTGLLSTWGEEESDATHDMEMGTGSGMMSDDDMAALESATGTEFDQQFLSMMVEHHEGAVAMAEVEIADGENPEAIALAEAIVAAQESEIDEMNGLIAELT